MSPNTLAWRFPRGTAACLVIALTAAAGGFKLMEAPALGKRPTAIAVRDVTLIDGTGAAARPGYTVIIAGNRITAVGPTGSVAVPKDAEILIGEGRFLIPGLWDAHVHWHRPDYLPLFLANGVTGIRLAWGEPKHRKWVRDINTEKLAGPRIYMAGAILDGPKPIWSFSRAVADENDGRKAVGETKELGADFVKVYSRLPREIFFAIADEARKQGIPFAGHVPDSVNAGEASDAGQRSIEHLSGILMASSSREDELRAQANSAASSDMLARRQIARAARESFEASKAERLFSRLVKNRTWQVPTLVIQRNLANLEDPKITSDPRARYLPDSITKTWNPGQDIRTKGRSPEELAAAKEGYAEVLRLVGQMNRAGVALAAGTDVFTLYTMPGFSLHDELALLVEAGLTPMQALQAATLSVAQLIGRQSELGTIEPGKLADCVLLDADPLADIRNITRINAVVSDGRLLTRSALDKMLEAAEKHARSN